MLVKDRHDDIGMIDWLWVVFVVVEGMEDYQFISVLITVFVEGQDELGQCGAVGALGDAAVDFAEFVVEDQ